jgi:hypothetical protein
MQANTIQAFPTSTTDQRRDHTGIPIDAVVAVTEINLSFGTVFRLALFFCIAQALIGVAVLIVLLTVGLI